jgi:putative flippase GtrA
MKTRDRIDKLLSSKDMNKFIRFAFVGGTIFVLNTVLQWFVRRVLHLEDIFSIWGVFLLVTVCHFIMNNFFAFKDSNARYKKRISRYVVFVVCSTLANSLLMYSFLTYIADNVLAASVAITGTMMFVNFFILNKLVFYKK